MISKGYTLQRHAQGFLSLIGNRCAALFIGVAVVSLAGCGGGGSSGSAATDDQEAIELASLEGSVKAPGGVVADFRAPSLLRYASEFFLPSAVAQITGLGAVIDAEVNLVRVNDDGERQGEPLATVKTDGDGKFEIPLENALLASGDLMLQVVGQNDNLLRAPVVSSKIDVDPLSEFVIAKLLESGAGLASVNTGRLASLMAEVKKTELDFSDPNLTLASIRGELEEKLGDVVKAQVDAATKKAGPGGKIAGTYDSVGIGFGFRDNERFEQADFVISFASVIDMEVSNSGNGEFEWLLSEELYGYTLVPKLVFGGECCPYFSKDIDELNETFEGIFGDDLVSRILLPPDEESYTSDLGKVVVNSTPSAFVNQSSVDFSTAVGSWRTNEDRVYVGPDGEREPDGRTLERYLEVFLRQPKNASLADVAGTYGHVALDTYGSNSGSGSTAGYSISSDIGKLEIQSAGNASYTEITSTGTGRDEFGPVHVGKDGTITLDLDDGDENIEFISSDTFNFIAHAGVDGSDPSTSSGFFESETLFSLGVRLPDSGELPTLSGKRYRVFHLAVDGNVSDDNSGDSKEFERTNVHSVETVDFDTFMTFESNTSASFSGALEAVVLGDNDLKIQTSKVRWSNEKAAVDLGDDGRLKISSTASDSSRVLDGFVNSDGSMAVLRLSEEPNGDNEAVLGMVILVQVSPDA